MFLIHNSPGFDRESWPSSASRRISKILFLPMALFIALAFSPFLHADCGEEVSLEIVLDDSAPAGSCCYKFVFKNNTNGPIKAGAIIIETPNSRKLIDQVFSRGIDIPAEHVAFDDYGSIIIYRESEDFNDVLPASQVETGEFVIATICFDGVDAWEDYNGNLRVFFEYEVNGQYFYCEKEILAKSCLGPEWDEFCCDGFDLWWEFTRNPCPPNELTRCVLRYRAHYWNPHVNKPLTTPPVDPYWSKCSISSITLNGKPLERKLSSSSSGEIPAYLLEGAGPLVVNLYDRNGNLKCSKVIEKPAGCP